MKLTKDELKKVKGKVETIESPADKAMRLYIEELRKLSDTTQIISTQALATMRASNSELAEALRSRPTLNKLYVNRDSEGLIESVDVNYINSDVA